MDRLQKYTRNSHRKMDNRMFEKVQNFRASCEHNRANYEKL